MILLVTYMACRLSYAVPLSQNTKFGGKIGYFGVLSRPTPTLV